MEVANEEMSEYELISVGGNSEFIFLTFNLRKVNRSERQAKYCIYVWYEIQSPKEMARVVGGSSTERRG